MASPRHLRGTIGTTGSTQGVPAAAALIRAIDMLRDMNRRAVLTLPKSAPISFIRERWVQFMRFVAEFPANLGHSGRQAFRFEWRDQIPQPRPQIGGVEPLIIDQGRKIAEESMKTASGSSLRPGELIPAEALGFVAAQVGATPEALAAYAARFQTRYQQLDALREVFGFAAFAPEHRREILAWLLPVALATTASIAATLKWAA
jgi:uncharacterized protein DUF4158